MNVYFTFRRLLRRRTTLHVLTFETRQCKHNTFTAANGIVCQIETRAERLHVHLVFFDSECNEEFISFKIYVFFFFVLYLVFG